VEVHLRSSEWNAHGHQHDPAYDPVVLHVVFKHDAEVRTVQGRTLPTVELYRRISRDSIDMHLELMRSQLFVPCARRLHHTDPLRNGAWLDRVLVERLERKTMDVEGLYQQLDKDPSATLYHILARAFGMKVNAIPFGMLAHALPLNVLQKYRDDAFRTEALLFGQAGLLQVDLVDEYPRRMQGEHSHLARMHGLRPAPLAAWKFGRIRPVNFPTVRIAQFAQLLIRLDGMLNDLLEVDDVLVLRQLIEVEASDYWTTHYRFDTPSAGRPKRIGLTVADHLIINAVVPVLFALGRLHGRPDRMERAIRLLEQLPAERNSVIDGWAGVGMHADSASRGQALIELRSSYCDKRRCLSCGIGNQLLRSTVKSR
jgi:hypothetical protein